MHQTRLLLRTFFDRLFESELMPEGLPQVQLVIWSMLLAATPTAGYALILIDKYAVAVFAGPLGPVFAADRMVLITLTMMAMGMVGLIIWDGVFPDRRDVRILGPLPVPTFRFVLARLGALAQVFLLFAAPVCLLQSLIFPMAVASYGDPVGRWHGMLAHLLTVLAAGGFVFSTLVWIQCMLLFSFGRRAAQHVSMAFQLLFAVGVIQLVFFLPDLIGMIEVGGAAQDGLPAVAALPPAWFFGLYQLLTGTADANGAVLGRVAAAATALSAALTVAMYAATHALLSRRALEGPPPPLRAALRQRLGTLLERLPLPGFNMPLRKAVRQFTVRTLGRSRYHRMMFAVYAGVALAIVVSSAVSVVVRSSGAGLWKPDVPMLSMPLILQFLMLIGLRVVIAVPSEPKARWIFRAVEPSDRHAAVLGARDAMLVLVVYPTTALALLQGLVFWGAAAAVSHTLFCWAVGRLFAEILLGGMDKLPFACTYYPGQSKVFTLWPLYLIVFFIYTLMLAFIDLQLTTRPRGLLVFLAITGSAAVALRLLRRRKLARLGALRFEEEDPDLLFQGFNLSEGLAAAATPVKRSTDRPEATAFP
jgi:hypothetical protein